MHMGSWDLMSSGPAGRESYKVDCYLNILERMTKEGDSPVRENDQPL